MVSFRVRIFALAVGTALAVSLGQSASALARGPVKLVLADHIGWEVNVVSKGELCSVGGECRSGVPTSNPGGFEFPGGVAVSPSDDLYVSDRGNHRVEEITESGEFILEFGQEVDKTKDAFPGATATEKDVCTAASGDTCGAGVGSSSAGGLVSPSGLAVDQVTGAVYVIDFLGQRVDKYSAAGEFIWTVGKEVNATEDGALGASEAQENLCTAASSDTCKAGVSSSPESSELCAFNFGLNLGNGVAIGGAEKTVFIADAHRIQKLTPGGPCEEPIGIRPQTLEREPQGEITALAANVASVYVAYGKTDTVERYSFQSQAWSEEIKDPPGVEGGAPVQINALAVDPSGDLAIASAEGSAAEAHQLGALFNAGTKLEPVSFIVPGPVNTHGVHGIAFDSKGDLYANVTGTNELLGYRSEPVAQLTTGTAVPCSGGPVVKTNDSFGCELEGVANTFGVPSTEVWFEWGRTCKPPEDERTPAQPLATPEGEQPVSVSIQGVRPNQEYCYRFAGVDEHVKLPEELVGGYEHFTTPIAPPRIAGEPQAEYVTSSSADVFGEVNPENTSTESAVEYGPPAELEACVSALTGSCGSEVRVTETHESALYGTTGVTFSLSGLRPDTTYRYRLGAVNDHGQPSEGEAPGEKAREAEFTTSSLPAPTATTGGFTALSATTAAISGAVDPGGHAAAYSFELGVAKGDETQYGVVVSGAVPAVEGSVGESYLITGLQPGTHYRYRISLSSMYVSAPGHTVRGGPVEFVTEGLPEVIKTGPGPQQLAVPPFRFPAASKVAPKLTRAQLLARALKACKKQSRKRRAGCVRQAHKRYGRAAVKRTASKRRS